MKKVNEMTREELIKYVEQLKRRLVKAKEDAEWYKNMCESIQAEVDELKRTT